MSSPVSRGGEREVLFVAGSGRSGTSTLTGLLQRLGSHVPEPQVPPDETNPRGFSESQWVVDLHDSLLRRAVVRVNDARPQAWAACEAVAASRGVTSIIQHWLDDQLVSHPRLVVKDPRLSWFLPAWARAAEAEGAHVHHAMSLRHPAEVVASKQLYYQGRFGEIHAVAAWLNMVLGTEHQTRGHSRVLVRYDHLLADPVATLVAVGRHWGGTTWADDMDRLRNAAAFVDSSLHRLRRSWADVDVPEPLRDLAESTWSLVSGLCVGSEGTADDEPKIAEQLDEVRARFARMYAESEALTRSTASAVRLDERNRHTLRGRARRIGLRIGRLRDTLGSYTPGGTPHG
jgi:hypothetical protein